MSRNSFKSNVSGHSKASRRSGRSVRSGRSRKSDNIIKLHTEGSAERYKEPSKFDILKTGALKVLRKITKAKQFISSDPKRFENLGGEVTQGQMVAKIERTWGLLDECGNSECILIEN